MPYFIFAMKAKADFLDTIGEILGFYAERNIDPLDQADAIVVDAVGILHNFPLPAFNYFSEGELPDPGWFFELGEDDALADFLTRLVMVVPPVPHTADPGLLPYLLGAHGEAAANERSTRSQARWQTAGSPTGEMTQVNLERGVAS